MDWYLKYWSKYGIKAVVDAIRKCELKPNVFCELLKTNPKQLQDNSKSCKFDEWLEVIVDELIDDSTKMYLAQHPPMTFKVIMAQKDAKREQYLNLLKSVLVGSDVSPKEELTYELAQRPLMNPKYNKVAVANKLIEMIFDCDIPENLWNATKMTFKDSYFYDKEIVSFFSEKTNIGRATTEFLFDICRILDHKRDLDAKYDHLKYADNFLNNFHCYWTHLRYKFAFCCGIDKKYVFLFLSFSLLFFFAANS